MSGTPTLFLTLLIGLSTAVSAEADSHQAGSPPPPMPAAGARPAAPSNGDLSKPDGLDGLTPAMQKIATQYLGYLQLFNSLPGKTVDDKCASFVLLASAANGLGIGALGNRYKVFAEVLKELPGKDNKEKTESVRKMLRILEGETVEDKAGVVRRLILLMNEAAKAGLVELPEEGTGEKAAPVPSVSPEEKKKTQEALRTLVAALKPLAGDDGFLNHKDLAPIVDSLMTEEFLDEIASELIQRTLPGEDRAIARSLALGLYRYSDPALGLKAKYYDEARKLKPTFFKEAGRVVLPLMLEMGVEIEKPKPGEAPPVDGPAHRKIDVSAMRKLAATAQEEPRGAAKPAEPKPAPSAAAAVAILKQVAFPKGLPVRPLEQLAEGEIPSLRISVEAKTNRVVVSAE